MKTKMILVVIFCFVMSLQMIVGCSTTQKTGGAGLVSVVAQNVVRIAGVKAIKEADVSSLSGKATYVKLTGFIDDQNRGFIDHLARSRAEDAGARLVSEDKAQLMLEVVVNSAGNDRGGSRIPVISRSERTEGTVDLDIIIRNTTDGTKILTQNVRGEAKYEQTSVIGIQGSGTYYVKNSKGKYVEVPNPTSYR
jgi:hypothetical protein